MRTRKLVGTQKRTSFSNYGVGMADVIRTVSADACAVH